MESSTSPYNKGDQVPDEGEYVCVPCGYHKKYKVGEIFGECMSCLSGTPEGQHEEFVEGQEMWEKVAPPLNNDQPAKTTPHQAFRAARSRDRLPPP